MSAATLRSTSPLRLGLSPPSRSFRPPKNLIRSWPGATEPEVKVAYDQLVEGRETNATSGPVVGNHSQVRSSALVPAIEKLLLQGLDPALALAEATAEARGSSLTTPVASETGIR